MRVLPLLAGLFLLTSQPALADEEDRREIRRLQERVDLLEAKLNLLLAAAPAPPVAPTQPAIPPSANPPALTTRVEVTPPELLPELGKIGAQAGFILSGSANPFRLNNGQDVAGFIDLPLFEPKHLHGKISYEIRIGLSQSKTKFQTTSNVAQVANLTALTVLNPSTPTQNVIDSATGTGAAPFTVRGITETHAKVLQIVPFSFKYQLTALDRIRLRPYAVAGFGMYVTIHRQVPFQASIRADAQLPADQLALVNQLFGGTASGGALVGGQIRQSPELEERGLPFGAGNIDFGLHTGGGIELRLTRGLSLGFDGRYNRLSGGQTLGTFGTRIGWHF